VVEGSYHSQARYLSVGISQSDPAKVEPFRRYEIQRDAFLDLLLFDFYFILEETKTMVGCDLPWLLKSAPSGRTTANNREIASASAGEGSPRNLTLIFRKLKTFRRFEEAFQAQGGVLKLPVP
jgi:hypothetical protein